jgi:hypothetical protein
MAGRDAADERRRSARFSVLGWFLGGRSGSAPDGPGGAAMQPNRDAGAPLISASFV